MIIKIFFDFHENQLYNKFFYFKIHFHNFHDLKNIKKPYDFLKKFFIFIEPTLR